MIGYLIYFIIGTKDSISDFIGEKKLNVKNYCCISGRILEFSVLTLFKCKKAAILTFIHSIINSILNCKLHSYRSHSLRIWLNITGNIREKLIQR